MSSSLSVATASDVDVEHDPTNGYILELDNILQYLLKNGLLSDIECRKIVIREDEYFIEVHAAIYDVMFTKDSKEFKKILDVFRKMVHPFQNPKILLRIFSYLKFTDIAQCRRAFPCWKEIIDLLVASKFDQVDLEQILLKNLLSKNEKIPNIEHPYRKNEKKSSVFQLMLAINPENDETILEILQIGRDVPPGDNNGSMNVVCVTENKIYNLIAISLSNRTVLSNVFQFLSLSDIKNCRRVCRTWNAVSEPFLRKISTIKFYSEFGPIEFINVSKFLPLPELPFNAFRFRDIFSAGYLLKFFTKFGKNIQCLDLCLRMGVGSCLSQTSNLTELHLQGGWLNAYDSHPKPHVMIPWNNMHSINILYLKDTIIEVDKDKEWKRITPLKVHLDHVIFFVDGCYPKEVTLNDYIDFIKVTDVNIEGQYRQNQKFDWARDIFRAERIVFSNTRFVNTETSKSAVDYLRFDRQHLLSEKIYVSIKQLIIEQGVVSLSALPPSLEKLMIGGQYYSNNIYMESVNLPNLSCLSCQKYDGFNLLASFYNCPNLSEIEILDVIRMDIRLLPRSIKRLKVKSRYDLLDFNEELADTHIDLDLLILSSVSAYRLNHFQFDKLRPKVLVVEVSDINDYEPLVSFIRRNKNMEKIYLKFQDQHRSVFSGSEFSKIVDKESAYYEFSNERGRAITSEEFSTYYKLVDIETDMKACWKTTAEEERANKERNDFYERFNTHKRRLRL